MLFSSHCTTQLLYLTTHFVNLPCGIFCDLFFNTQLQIPAWKISLSLLHSKFTSPATRLICDPVNRFKKASLSRILISTLNPASDQRSISSFFAFCFLFYKKSSRRPPEWLLQTMNLDRESVNLLLPASQIYLEFSLNTTLLTLLWIGPFLPQN